MALYRNLQSADLIQQDLVYPLRQASVDTRPRRRAHHERRSYASLLGSRTSGLPTGMNAAPSSSSAMVASAPRRIQLRSTQKAAWSS